MIRYTDPNDKRTEYEAVQDNDLIELEGITVIGTRDDKGRLIVPDDIFSDHYKELPNAVRAQDGRIAMNGGVLRPLNTVDPEEAAEIRRQGANALNAKHAQRQSIADTIDAMLRSKAGQEEIERFNLPDGATKQDALVAAMYAEAINKGTVRAADFIRDTAGEKPIDRQQVQADIMTEADKILIEKIKKRLDHNM